MMKTCLKGVRNPKQWVMDINIAVKKAGLIIPVRSVQVNRRVPQSLGPLGSDQRACIGHDMKEQ